MLFLPFSPLCSSILSDLCITIIDYGMSLKKIVDLIFTWLSLLVLQILIQERHPDLPVGPDDVHRFVAARAQVPERAHVVAGDAAVGAVASVRDDAIAPEHGRVHAPDAGVDGGGVEV